MYTPHQQKHFEALSVAREDREWEREALWNHSEALRERMWKQEHVQHRQLEPQAATDDKELTDETDYMQTQMDAAMCAAAAVHGNPFASSPASRHFVSARTSSFADPYSFSPKSTAVSSKTSTRVCSNVSRVS